MRLAIVLTWQAAVNPFGVIATFFELRVRCSDRYVRLCAFFGLNGSPSGVTEIFYRHALDLSQMSSTMLGERLVPAASQMRPSDE